MLLVIASMFVLCAPACAEFWTLSRYLGEVFRASDNIKAAEEDVELARSGYISSLATFYLPSVVLSAENSPYSVFNDPKWRLNNDNTTAGTSANLNLFNNFKDKLAFTK